MGRPNSPQHTYAASLPCLPAPPPPRPPEQSYLEQLEDLVERKAKVLGELVQELNDEMAASAAQAAQQDWAADAPSSASASAAGGSNGGGGEGRDGEPGDRPLPAADELRTLVQLEYWAKFDILGCVRKLLPPLQQARCVVASYPFHPDLKQFELAIKEHAGQLWRQLQVQGN